MAIRVDSEFCTVNENCPLPSLIVAVVVSLIFTVAPAMGFPDESTIYPVTFREPVSCPMAGRPQKRENKSSKAICFIIILLRSGGSVEQLFYLHELIVVEIACRFVACTGTLLLVKRFDFFEVCGHQRSDTGVGDTRLPHIYTQERNFFFPICFACRMAARYVGTISQRDYCLIIGEGFC